MIKTNIFSIAVLSTTLLVSGISADTNGANSAKTEKAAPIVGDTVVGVATVNSDNTIDTAVADVITSGYRASKLLYSSVYNQFGEKIGTINDIVISPEKKVTVAIVTVGDFLGVPQKFVALPAMLFTTNNRNQLVLPNTAKSDLMSLPAFTYTW